MARVLLINDTALKSSHFGCQLVVQTVREQLARVGLTLAGSLSKDFELADLAKLRGAFDFILVNGEGSIHGNKNTHMVRLAADYPAALVNCVYEDNRQYRELGRFLLISARESSSADEIRRQGVACEVTPDFLFGSSAVRSYAALLNARRDVSPPPVLREIGRTDSVRSPKIHLGPLRVRLTTARQPFGGTPAEHLEYIASSRRMVIGRFHAACAAAALGVPFTSWDSNTWKIRAMMHDMGASAQHFATERAATEAVASATIPASVTAYVAQAPALIEALFDRIAEIAEPYSALPR
jgi:hypothetical protein